MFNTEIEKLMADRLAYRDNTTRKSQSWKRKSECKRSSFKLNKQSLSASDAL